MKTTLHFTEPLVRRAVFAFWWSNIGWSYVGAVAFVSGSMGLLIAFGDRSWLVEALGAALSVAFLIAGGLYWSHYRASLQRFRRMKRPEAVLEVTEIRLRLESDAGISEVAWSLVVDVWQFPEFWLLFFSRSQFITLPLADLDEGMRAEILRHTGYTSTRHA